MRSGEKIFRTNLGSFLVASAVFIFSAAFLFVFKENAGGKFFFMYAGLTASYYAYNNIHQSSSTTRQISRGILFGLAGVLLLFLIIITIRAATSNAQWDFLCFYIEGLLGVHHLNFYDPNSYTVLMDKINFHPSYDSAFKAETLDVGLVTPPITMLFYAPIATFEYHTSRIVLTLLIFIFIIANAFLANKLLIKNNRSFYSFLFCFIIIMLIPGTNETMIFNQTNFFLLFFLILAILNLEKPTAGIYLALSVIFKPISAILILFFILHKKWRTVVYFAATGVLLTLVTGFIWGFQNIFQYFVSPPTKRIPSYLYEENINQSLISEFNRNLKPLGVPHHLISLLFYFCVGILIVTTCIMSRKLSKIKINLSFLPFIPCILMIYPGTLDHYMVYLLPVFIYFLFSDLSNKYLYATLIIAIGLLRIESFFAYLILWVIFLWMSFFQVSPDGQKSKTVFTS